MREIEVAEITKVVRELCIDSNFYVAEDVVIKMKKFLKEEESPTGKEILNLILDNHELAKKEKMALCQDTGVAVTFVEYGQDIHIVGGSLTEAINQGVREAYQEGYLRKSMVDDPVIKRKNTGDNTPSIIYTDIVPGDQLKITIAAKGGGAENMSEVKMMKAADGIEGVKEFVIDRVLRSGGNPCPPIVVGVGLGGNFEQSALLAKKALLRPLTEKNPDPEWNKVEEELLKKINDLGIGPQGLGGRTTALAVQIRHMPCHIASMPVAVNVQCHCHRHISATI